MLAIKLRESSVNFAVEQWYLVGISIKCRLNIHTLAKIFVITVEVLSLKIPVSYIYQLMQTTCKNFELEI